jgi:hypothetical protein
MFRFPQLKIIVWSALLPALATSMALAQGNTKKSSQAAQFESVISAGEVRPHIEFLADPKLQGRSGKGAREAAEYIEQRFRAWGLRPLFEGNRYDQEIPGREDEDGTRPTVGRNVAGWIRGSDPKLADEFVIVSAHYDHLGVMNGRVFRGADDNATGVSMMLEVARRIANSEQKPRRSMVFIGFDLEERLLWGSRWFAAHPPWPIEQVKFFITADMIGRSLGDLPLPVVFAMGSEHSPQLKTALDNVGEPLGLEVARLGIDLIGTRSDYGPFRDRKIPFLFFSTGEHPDYHTPRDVPERIDYDKVARVAGLVLRLSQTVADEQSPPEWTDTIKTDLDEARALNRIATLLLEQKGDKELSSLQQLLVTQARNRTGQILERGEMTLSERTWLIRMSQLMLLSVF